MGFEAAWDRGVDQAASPSKFTEAVSVTVLAALYAVAFSWRLFPRFGTPSFDYDWAHFRDMDWASLGDPESRMLNPFLPLHWLFGQTVGINLELPLHLFIAFVGGWVLARTLKLDWLAALTCAVVYPSSSWIYLHFAVGHLSFLPFAYTPLAIAFLLRGSPGWIAALFALMFFEGAVYPVVETGVLLGLLAVAFAIRRRSWWPIAALILAAMLTAVFAAPKLIPTSKMASRLVGPEGHLSLAGDAASFFSRDQSLRLLTWLEVGTMGMWEGGAYLSPFIVPLVLCGVCSASVPWLIGAVALLILGLGDYFGPHSAYWLLHFLPIVSWTRISPRFFILVILCLGVLAAYGVERLTRSRAGTVLALMLLALGLCDFWWVSTASLR